MEIYIEKLLEDIQSNMFERAKTYRDENTTRVSDWDTFKKQIEKGGFVIANWDGSAETEEKIKEETKATIRCIPFDIPQVEGKCIYSNKDCNHTVLFARAH
jgi:prolyl-tRNA synthetase